ncbi:MAG: family transcriptional regulator, cyclic receptor protein, partial [Rhodospirillaceae bacterium]|nr:family transcriptional regulator, cyclic receptor protein [Rhodospirillaceae bacterium]
MNTNASHASQLRVISLFEDLQPAELLQVAGLCTMQACEKHTQIMGEQDQTTDVFFILAGSVRISSYTEAGREVIFTEMHAGDIFGEFSAVDRLPRSASIVALSDCLMARMPSAKFFEVLRGHADIAVRLIELLVVKIRK